MYDGHELVGATRVLSFLMVVCCVQFYVSHFHGVWVIEYVLGGASNNFQLELVRDCSSLMACCIREEGVDLIEVIVVDLV